MNNRDLYHMYFASIIHGSIGNDKSILNRARDIRGYITNGDIEEFLVETKAIMKIIWEDAKRENNLTDSEKDNG